MAALANLTQVLLPLLISNHCRKDMKPLGLEKPKDANGGFT